MRLVDLKDLLQKDIELNISESLQYGVITQNIRIPKIAKNEDGEYYKHTIQIVNQPDENGVSNVISYDNHLYDVSLQAFKDIHMEELEKKYCETHFKVFKDNTIPENSGLLYKSANEYSYLLKMENGKVKIYIDDNTDEKFINIFDEKGNLVIQRIGDDTITSKFSYDRNNRLKKSVTKYNKDQVVTIDCKYDYRFKEESYTSKFRKGSEIINIYNTLYEDNDYKRPYLVLGYYDNNYDELIYIKTYDYLKDGRIMTEELVLTDISTLI